MTRLDALLEASAAGDPDKVALEDPARDTSMTYGELDRRADELCAALQDLGVGPGDRVGLCAPKSVGTITALFAVLKAGAAYVPVAYDAPLARNAFIFADCGVKAVFVDADLADGLREEYAHAGLGDFITIESLKPYGANLCLALASEGIEQSPPEAARNLAYILYTSGSTGKPKGVMHTHETALSFVDWCSEAFEPTSEDRFSSHAPLHFDLSILDIYLPIKHGATLVLIGESLGKQPLLLGPIIAERAISFWYSTPSILRLLLENGRLDAHDFSALKVVFFAGEVFPLKHFHALKKFWPHPRYFNLFGPTETNVCTYFEVPADLPDSHTDPFPIGKVCSGDQAKVMDENHQEVAIGEEGELYVTGGSVMIGYWNLPEQNESAFFTDPQDGQWYRTGDIVKQDEDSCYAYLGRRDRMVKRRGYRVELGEIESALYRHPSITEAAVVATPDEDAGVAITAFLTWTGEKKLSMIAMKQFCSKNVPLYMIPDRFRALDELPKTSTDKIDYQRLKTME
jgi:amino acid adenylation domain-containing protein